MRSPCGWIPLLRRDSSWCLVHHILIGITDLVPCYHFYGQLVIEDILIMEVGSRTRRRFPISIPSFLFWCLVLFRTSPWHFAETLNEKVRGAKS
jgi:hypothetical protein